jgi:hypothetical protein
MLTDGRELRRLLGTFWFRSVFTRLSPAWREHVLNVLVEQVTIPNYTVKVGRRPVRLDELTQEQRRQMMTDPGLADAIRGDLQLLVTVAMLWGDEALGRFTYTHMPEAADTSKIAQLLQPFRHS